MAYYLVILALGCALLTTVKSHCFRGEGRITPAGASFCEYGNVTMLDGEQRHLPDCLTCTCDGGMLECCYSGKRAGHIETPNGCVITECNCKVRLVKKSDETKDCETGDDVIPCSGNTDVTVPMTTAVDPALMQNAVGIADQPAMLDPARKKSKKSKKERKPKKSMRAKLPKTKKKAKKRVKRPRKTKLQPPYRYYR